MQTVSISFLCARFAQTHATATLIGVIALLSPLGCPWVAVRAPPAQPRRVHLRSDSDAKDSIPRFPAYSNRSRTPGTPNPRQDPPRSWSYPIARSGSVVMLRHDPTPSFVVRAGVASEPASFVRASPATLVCHSREVLPSGATTRSLADTRRPSFLRRPERFVHPTGDRLDCLAASSGNTSSIG